MPKPNPPFWITKPLPDLSGSEWESLCDGCAKCCLHRFEDEDTQEIFFTNVCCRYLDQSICQCTEYNLRSVNVPECVTVTPELLQDPYWLPETCAYRLLAEGKELPHWHPLITGTPESVRNAGQSIGGRVISELETDELEHHMIDWVR